MAHGCVRKKEEEDEKLPECRDVRRVRVFKASCTVTEMYVNNPALNNSYIDCSKDVQTNLLAV